MEKLTIHKNKIRDTATIPSLGMLAYRIFTDTECINIQLLSGEQEECTIPLNDGEMFKLRDIDLYLSVTN
ncbi:hypothetical protein DOK67_0001248 [Enterococcus sp. DIV0212c]|uniref:hypothetical protein n=1 Tax=Enterococcus sp. DIV0212c TaxID=2230867 RepID=UPI001A9AB3ED|nr:hypothetical protein [Enterococcus sp. DIV0212c]MBO1353629.1 hypothetical protein [Enterococcus sp. DIV0212c]